MDLKREVEDYSSSCDESELEYDENEKQKNKEDNDDADEKIKNEGEDEDEEEDEDEDDEDDEEDDLNEDEEELKISYGSTDHYKPTFEEKRKLAAMKIELRHTPPLQHTIEKTAGTRALKSEEKIQFEKYVPLKTGTFLSYEDKILKKNWKTFCKLYNWDEKNPKPFLFMKHDNKEFLLRLKYRIKFVQFLAKGLNNRSLYSVYHRFKILYEPHKKTRYQPEEDNVIVNYIINYDNDKPDRKFADLASMLKRTRASVWRRYRVLKKKNCFLRDHS